MIDVNHVSVTYKIANGNIRSIKEYIITFLRRKLKYTTFNALDDVTFHINKGDVVGIIGENGAGKSTLLKVISGIFKPTKGTATLGGSLVPMLELGCGFDTELSGRENIYLNGAILGFSKEYLDQKYEEIVEFSELGNFINQPIRTYSSGMLMRLGFAIAVSTRPDILIVDEIMAVGDDRFQAKSKAKMKELMSGGATVLLVSHNMRDIRDLCNKVIYLEHGKIKMMGDTETVCNAYENRE